MPPPDAADAKRARLLPSPGSAPSRQISDSRPPRLGAFDPVGEIAICDRRAQERSAAADRFAASFGIDELGPSAEAIADRYDVRFVAADAGPAGRRTVTITGQGARPVIAPRARPPGVSADHARGFRRGAERSRPREFRGDRAALWAVGLGLLLILAAAASAHAAVLSSVLR